MPKKKRSPQEIERIKDNILEHAVDILIKHGYEGLSLRKLADRLGFAAKTIYNYYNNKDEIYLMILIKGYNELYERCLQAYNSKNDPHSQLEAMGNALLDFAFEKPNFYDLMFTLHVPKYNDYLNTPMQKIATKELETSFMFVNLFITVIKQCVPVDDPMSTEEAKRYGLLLWSIYHGYVAGCNNSLLNYHYDDPHALKAFIHKNATSIINDYINNRRFK